MKSARAQTARLADVSAISLSALCLIHCLALPMLAATFPVAASVAEAEWLHKLFALAALPISGWVILREQAGRRAAGFTPLALGGLALLLAAAFVEALHDFETTLTVTGAALLAGAHILRWRRFTSKSSHQKDLY